MRHFPTGSKAASGSNASTVQPRARQARDPRANGQAGNLGREFWKTLGEVESVKGGRKSDRLRNEKI